MAASFKILILIVFSVFGIFLPDLPQTRQMERLDRGLVAVRTGSEEVFISWRLLGTDDEKTGFNLYRGGKKLSRKPITGATNFTDSTAADEVYSVRPAYRRKEEASSSCHVWKQNYLIIPLNRPQGGVMEADKRQYSYSPGDAGVGDLDGDGQYEIVLKWDPSNARDNAQDGFTANVIIDAYKLDGRQLWRINLGRNIRAGAHYTQFLVYDFDGDGKAEMVCKTADGTTDGKGNVLGDASAQWVNSRGRIVDGPEYLTVFSGQTGEAFATTEYIPPRGNICAWGNNECNGNRVDRFLACVAYLDGRLPSIVMCRGYYGRLTICAWDWRNRELTRRWFFDSDKGYPAYMGQGNHNLGVADIDDDGKDEVIYGSSAYDDIGKPLYTTGMGHGDAMHLSDLDPDNPGLEVWGVKETGGFGSVMHDAATGKILVRLPSAGDTGRGLAADLYPEYPGYELWSSTSGGIFTCKGERITERMPSVNFRIYWDGDLYDELLDRSFIDDWDHTGHRPVRLLDASRYGGLSVNGTKATPVLSADLFGDWREEVVFRGTDNSSLLLFTTTIPTDYRLVTLMHDPVYRLGVAWQNVVYNQPPHTGYWLGAGKIR